MVGNAPLNRLDDLLTRLLDRGYVDATSQVLQSIAADSTSGAIQIAVIDLIAEAERLAEAGERLRPDNPVLRALLADLEPILNRQAARIDAAGADLQSAGMDAAEQLTRQLALPGVDDTQLAQIGVAWNRPDPEAVRQLVDFVNSAGWADELTGYTSQVMSTIRNKAVQGIVQGWNPLRTAREIRRTVEGFPAHLANNLMRTLQLQSYRRGAAIQQRANADILTEQIRVAVLDPRTCLACIALHGERLPVGEVVVDHHQGRCTSIAVVAGRPRDVQTGPEWFDSLSEDEQLAIAGPGALEALKSGKATLRDFVQPYEDRVFGEMVRQGSLDRALNGPGGGSGPRRPSRGGPPGAPTGGPIITQDGVIDDDPVGFSDIKDASGLDEYLFANQGTPRSFYMDATGALGFGDDGRIRVNKDVLREYIKDYVRGSRSVFEPRDVAQAMIQSNMRDLWGIDVTLERAEGIWAEEEARKADALLKLAEVAGLRLTEPQTRRLNAARDGGYVDMIYSEVGDTGTFENEMARRASRRSGIRKDSAEYRRMKDDFDRIMGKGRYR